MEFAVITGPNKTIAIPRIRLANTLKDGVELRLDLFTELSFDDVKLMRDACTKKIIFTFRGTTFSEESIRPFLELNPDYIDLEYGSHTEILKSTPCKVISSYHNYERTPHDLESLFEKMENPHSYAYKICTTAHREEDAFRMLKFIQTLHKRGVRIIGLCMGAEGRITRQDGIKAGNYLNYGILHKHDRCAPGLELHFT